MAGSTQQKLVCSIGVTAYNEEQNIGHLLEALVEQHLHRVEIAEIIVVASACTDRTVPIVRQYMARDGRVKLIEQPKREGKTSAINLFLAEASSNICVLESGDTIPHEYAVEHLVRMFDDETVGMVGAQKMAVDTPEHIVGLLSHLRLRMEHELCLEIPRLGEMIAFRKLFDQIPDDVAMDEAFVEAIVVKRGMSVRYAPDAIVYNTGPDNIADFVRQRRRNHAGHLYLKHKYGYAVSSIQNTRVMRIAFKEVIGVIKLLWVLFLLALVEAWSRLLGWYDFAIKRDRHVVWDMAWSQKQDVQDVRRANQPTPTSVPGSYATTSTARVGNDVMEERPDHTLPRRKRKRVMPQVVGRTPSVMKQQLWNLLKLAIGLALLVYLYSRLEDPARLWQQIVEADKWLLVAGALCYSGAVALGGYKWGILLEAAGLDVRFGRLLAYQWVAEFFNNFLPAQVGGDVVRGYALASDTHRAADVAASVLIDRFIGLTVFMVAAALGSVAMLLWGRPDGIPFTPEQRISVQVIALGSVGASLLLLTMLVAILSRRLKMLVERLLTRLAFLRFALPIWTKLAEAFNVYRYEYRALALVSLCSILIVLLTSVNIWLIAQAIQPSSISLLEVLTINPIIVFVGLALPFSPGGLGVRQSAFTATFLLMGAGGDIGLAVGLLQQFIGYLVSLPGGFWWMRGSARRAANKAQPV